MIRRSFTFLGAVAVVVGGMSVATVPAYAATVPAGQGPAAGAFAPAAAQKCTGDMDSSRTSVAVNCISGPGRQYYVATKCISPKNPEGYHSTGPWTNYGAPGVSRATCQSGYHTFGLGIGHR